MIEMDSEGFVINQSVLTPVTLGDVIDTLYKKIRTQKWMIMFFPLMGLEKLYYAVEMKYFTPGSGKNIGFELVPDKEDHTVIVMTYLPYMSQKQFGELVNTLTDRAFIIEDDAIVIFFAVKGEPEIARNKRKDLFVHFRDYTNKQVTGT